MIMSLRAHFAKQSPLETGGCFDGKAPSRNDMRGAVAKPRGIGCIAAVRAG